MVIQTGGLKSLILQGFSRQGLSLKVCAKVCLQVTILLRRKSGMLQFLLTEYSVEGTKQGWVCN